MLVLLLACATDAGVKGQNDTSVVPGEGVLTLDPAAVVWLDMSAGFSSTEDLNVGNSGVGDLQIYGAEIVEDLDDAFEFTEVSDLVITTGTTSTWSVRATLPADAPVYGTLRIRSDDPAAASVDVPLCAFPPGADPTCS